LPPLGGIGQHGLLDGPVARDVRLARRQARLPLRRVDRRVRELIVAIDRRRAADCDALEVARVADRRGADAHGRRRGAAGTNSSTFHPERRISVAARISQRISSGLPSAPTVSKYRYECGFTSSSFVSVPE
jgi:hypothetical protein